MKSTFTAVLVLACALAAGCDLLGKKNSDDTPTSPTSNTSIDAFAGTWQSVAASSPATGCGNLKYTVTPMTTSNANVSFTATGLMGQLQDCSAQRSVFWR